MIRRKSQRRRCCAPGWLIAGLVLVCGGWLSPPAARAGCSHYVTTRSDAARPGAADLDPLISPGILSREPWRGSPLGGPPARPCSGFGCSRDSRAPTTMPPAVPRIDALVGFDLSAIALQTPFSPFLPDDASPRSLDRADRLTRPPRP